MFLVYLSDESVYGSKNKVIPQVPKRIKILNGITAVNTIAEWG